MIICIHCRHHFETVLVDQMGLCCPACREYFALNDVSLTELLQSAARERDIDTNEEEDNGT